MRIDANIRFVIDTNLLSEPAKPKPHPAAMNWFAAHSAEYAIPTVVWHEFLYGIRRLPDSKRKRSLLRYRSEVEQSNIPFLNYNEPAAVWHASQRARLGKRGVTVPFADAQIAAIAAAHNLVLITANLHDFAAFADLAILDWRETGRH